MNHGPFPVTFISKNKLFCLISYEAREFVSGSGERVTPVYLLYIWTNSYLMEKYRNNLITNTGGSQERTSEQNRHTKLAQSGVGMRSEDASRFSPFAFTSGD